jgi:hypothetical protein
MRSDDFREHLEREPFQSFRVHLSSGAFFDIRHSQMAQVTRSTLHIALPLEGDRQRFAIIALVHIVWLEVLVPTP